MAFLSALKCGWSAVSTGCYHLLLIPGWYPKHPFVNPSACGGSRSCNWLHDTDYVLFGAPRSASRLNQMHAWERAQVQVVPQTDWRHGHRGTVWSAMNTNHGELFCIRSLLSQCSVLLTLGPELTLASHGRLLCRTHVTGSSDQRISWAQWVCSTDCV